MQTNPASIVSPRAKGCWLRRPWSPWQNAYGESFNSIFRITCLDRWAFESVVGRKNAIRKPNRPLIDLMQPTENRLWRGRVFSRRPRWPRPCVSLGCLAARMRFLRPTGVQRQQRARRQGRSRHLRGLVSRARSRRPARRSKDPGSLRRRHGRLARAGHRTPLRFQHRLRAPRHGRTFRNAVVKRALQRMHRRKGRRQEQDGALT